MRIRRPAGLSPFEIALVTIVGVLGGIYIWKPIFATKSKSINNTSAVAAENIQESKMPQKAGGIFKLGVASSPFTLLGVVVVCSTGLLIFYKFSIAPVLKRRRLQEAEEFADFIYKKTSHTDS